MSSMVVLYLAAMMARVSPASTLHTRRSQIVVGKKKEDPGGAETMERIEWEIEEKCGQLWGMEERRGENDEKECRKVEGEMRKEESEEDVAKNEGEWRIM